MKLGDLGEIGLIERIRHECIVRPAGVVQGIGDDCAVVAFCGGEYLLVTIDTLVEGIHFMPDLASLRDLGWKALAVNLSDIAAMAGTPRDAFLSLALPEGLDVADVDAFYDGLKEVARKYQVNLLGGDTCASPHGIVVTVAVTGTVAHDRVLYRSGAKVGDEVVLTGTVGDSAAGLALLQGGASVPESVRAPLIRAHLRPEPHLEESRFLASLEGVHAAIDVSDGLSVDLAHVCRASGLGAVLEPGALPVSSEARAAARTLGVPAEEWALHGGEDYVVLLAVGSESLEAVCRRYEERFGRPLFRIGEFCSGQGVSIRAPGGEKTALEPRGYDHFRARRGTR